MVEEMRLINHIRRLRFERDELTQQELADNVGVTRQTIIAVEAGKYKPGLVLGMRIARFFGVPVEQVFELRNGDAAQL